ncbi:MAG TPA: class I SAM-dependent methyltransferase [Saprospiraceae bacterium]|nr:class I SAM-dependent methyltransferase [Saprospiraceae bacterium]
MKYNNPILRIINYFFYKPFKRLVNHFGYEVQVIPKGLSYFDPKIEVSAAKEKNMSLCEYLETFNKGGVGKRRDFIISKINYFLPAKFEKILEIGAGTGMYLEKILEIYKPIQYEVYETNIGWTKYLKEEYGSRTNLICYNADGKTLKDTESNSVDIVFCHAVFVYISIVTIYSYFEDMVRVCKPGGYIIFDCFTSKNFEIDILKNWLKAGVFFPVVIADYTLEEWILKAKLVLHHKFNANYHESYTTYFILQK